MGKTTKDQVSDAYSISTLRKLNFQNQDFISINDIQEIKDQFLIVELAGQGSYGQVYKAIDKRTNIIRAIKQINMKEVGGSASPGRR